MTDYEELAETMTMRRTIAAILLTLFISSASFADNDPPLYTLTEMGTLYGGMAAAESGGYEGSSKVAGADMLFVPKPDDLCTKSFQPFIKLTEPTVAIATRTLDWKKISMVSTAKSIMFWTWIKDGPITNPSVTLGYDLSCKGNNDQPNLPGWYSGLGLSLAQNMVVRSLKVKNPASGRIYRVKGQFKLEANYTKLAGNRDAWKFAYVFLAFGDSYVKAIYDPDYYDEDLRRLVGAWIVHTKLRKSDGTWASDNISGEGEHVESDIYETTQLNLTFDTFYDLIGDARFTSGGYISSQDNPCEDKEWLKRDHTSVSSRVIRGQTGEDPVRDDRWTGTFRVTAICNTVP